VAEQKQLDDIGRVIRLIEIALTIGRHIIHVMWVFFGINVVLTVYNFAIGNTVWGIISLLFAIGGFIFIAQIYEHRNRHRLQRQIRRMEKQSEYRDAASA